MERSELIANAVLDKYGSGINMYTSEDILTAAGISEEDALKFIEELKNSIRNQVSK